MSKKKKPVNWQAREALIWSVIALVVSIGVLIFKIIN